MSYIQEIPTRIPRSIICLAAESPETQPNLLPFAFLFCSPDEVVSCQVRQPFLRDLGLKAVDYRAKVETFELLVDYLCSNSRSLDSDAEIAYRFLTHPSELKPLSVLHVNLADTEFLRKFAQQQDNLILDCMRCYNTKSNDVYDFMAMSDCQGQLVEVKSRTRTPRADLEVLRERRAVNTLATLA